MCRRSAIENRHGLSCGRHDYRIKTRMHRDRLPPIEYRSVGVEPASAPALCLSRGRLAVFGHDAADLRPGDRALMMNPFRRIADATTLIPQFVDDRLATRPPEVVASTD